MEAFQVVVGNAFSKKGSIPRQYPDKPFRITPYTEAEKAENQRKALQHTIDILNSWKGSKDNERNIQSRNKSKSESD